MAVNERALSTLTIVIVLVVLVIGAFGIGLSLFNFGENNQSTKTPVLSSTPTIDPTPTATPTTSFTQTTISTPIFTESPTKTRTPTRVPTDTPILTPTPTSTPLLTTTPTPTQTATQTSTPTPTEEDKVTPDIYVPFMNGYINYIGAKSEVPIKMRGVRVTEDGTIWTVINRTSSKTEPMLIPPEWRGLANIYAITWEAHKEQNVTGDRPSQLRVIEIAPSNDDRNVSTFTILEEDAIAVNNGEITSNNYTKRWFNRVQEPTSGELDFAYTIARNTKNGTLGG